MVICEAADANPYREDDLKVAHGNLSEKLADMDEVSQSHLENLLEEFSLPYPKLMARDGRRLSKTCFWSEGGGSFMDAGWVEHVSAVLTGDLSDYKALRDDS